jgi:hypothetical protein
MGLGFFLLNASTQRTKTNKKTARKGGATKEKSNPLTAREKETKKQKKTEQITVLVDAFSAPSLEEAEPFWTLFPLLPSPTQNVRHQKKHRTGKTSDLSSGFFRVEMETPRCETTNEGWTKRRKQIELSQKKGITGCCEAQV